MMKILISAFGSHGDVLPLIALSQEFVYRKCEVVFFANPVFHSKIEDDRIRFIPVGSQEEYLQLFNESCENDPVKSFKRIAQELIKLTPEYYALLKKEAFDPHTLLIHNSLLFAARLVSETKNIPCVAIHLAPSVFRSNISPARIVPGWIKQTTPLLIKRLAWWALDLFFYEPAFTHPLNNFRKTLGLPKVKRIFQSWIHEADMVIGIFPQWFAPPQNDWPKNLLMCGFPLFDQVYDSVLPKEVAAFLEHRSTTVIFSAGTATANANEFFTISVEVCRRLNIKGILLSPFKDHIPDNLPENVLYGAYAPFSLLLPHADIFVHHGGIGSISQAMHSGVAQIIRPVAYDQFDNSDRAVKLGVAKEILPADYTIENVQHAITKLMQDSTTRRNCKEMRFKMQSNDAIQTTCDTILHKFSCKNGD